MMRHYGRFQVELIVSCATALTGAALSGGASFRKTEVTVAAEVSGVADENKTNRVIEYIRARKNDILFSYRNPILHLHTSFLIRSFSLSLLFLSLNLSNLSK
jgi:hypothetical protein